MNLLDFYKNYLSAMGLNYKESKPVELLAQLLEDIYHNPLNIPNYHITTPARIGKTTMLQCFVAWCESQKKPSSYLFGMDSKREAELFEDAVPALLEAPLTIGAGGTVAGRGYGKHLDVWGGCAIVDVCASSSEEADKLAAWVEQTIAVRKFSEVTPLIVVDTEGFCLPSLHEFTRLHV